MRSADIGTLNTLVTAANGWRTAATAVNASLDILTTRINGEIVQLEWDPNMGAWEIRTMDSTFTARWIPDSDNPANSAWSIIAN